MGLINHARTVRRQTQTQQDQTTPQRDQTPQQNSTTEHTYIAVVHLTTETTHGGPQGLSTDGSVGIPR